MDVPVDNWIPVLENIEGKLLQGSELGFADAQQLVALPAQSVGDLVRVANGVRRRFAGNKADLCSIVNARSGICAENCTFCAQSSHYGTGVPVYPMKPAPEILDAARQAEATGARRFCIVTSGETLSDRDFETVLEALGLIRKKTGLKRCASIGRLTRERAVLLKRGGLDRYHHNIETARGFYPQVCTTHTYDDKLRTIFHLKEAGIETCVGGILNLGESPRHRIEFAFEIRALEPDSVPINFLIPQPGTPLGGRKPISALEAARYLAIFRLVLPRASIRLAGGRVDTFVNKPTLPYDAGVNALLIGDLLTTSGPDTTSDIVLLNCLGFDTEGHCD